MCSGSPDFIIDEQGSSTSCTLPEIPLIRCLNSRHRSPVQLLYCDIEKIQIPDVLHSCLIRDFSEERLRKHFRSVAEHYRTRGKGKFIISLVNVNQFHFEGIHTFCLRYIVRRSTVISMFNGPSAGSSQ